MLRVASIAALALLACMAAGLSPIAAAKAKPVPPSGVFHGRRPQPQFFFYFNKGSVARTIAATLKAKGWSIELDPPGDGVKQWGLIATGDPVGMGWFAADDAFERWAKSIGIDYDGNQFPIAGCCG